MPSISDANFIYRAHGLTLAAPLPCPELMPSSHPPEIFIRYGPVPDELPNPVARGVLYQIGSEQCLLDLRRFAAVRFLIQNGNEIVIERTEKARDNTIRLFLLGSCMAALLVQRGVLPFHGSTILAPHGAMLFSGPSTAGKSTLAAAFLRKGYPVLADDISTVYFSDEGPPTVAPELKRLKLWTHALAHLDIAMDTLERIRPEMEKYSYPLDAFVTQPEPLHTFYLLQVHNRSEMDIGPVEGMEKFASLRQALYHGEYLPAQQFHAAWFQRLSRLAQSTRIRRVRFPHDLSRLSELVERIEQDFMP